MASKPPVSVPGHRFLYRRGGVYWFRRAVPEKARAAFGKVEVTQSLGAVSLAEARHKLARCLRDFDRLVAAATGQADPTRGAEADRVEPTKDDIERAVRAWLKERVGSAAPVDYSAPEKAQEGHERLRDLDRFAGDVEATLRPGGGGAKLMTEWTAEAIQQENGWAIPENSPLHNQLLRTVARGQAEASRQLAQEVDGTRRHTLDALFGPEQFALDLTRPKAKPVSIRALFDGYVAEAKPKPATVKAWRRHIEHFVGYLGHNDSSKVRPLDVIGWKDKLLNEPTPEGTPRNARTVRDTYLAGVRAVFRWAVENQKIETDPTAGVRVRVPKKARLREKGLTDAEAEVILNAALMPASTRLSPEYALARRWVPWLCAYTGARVNEMTQLRADDVRKIDGVWTVRITPEAGTVKNGQARTVPLHPHLVEQGFIEAIAGKSGPLFYEPTRHRGGSDENPQFKKVGERLAKWAREIGVTDPEVAPNHGWRHRFKTQARLAGIDAETRDAIQGHKPRTEGEEYGHFPMAVLAREIEKLKRYQVGANHRPPVGEDRLPPVRPRPRKPAQ